MQITRSTIDTIKGPGDWFTGDVYIDAVAAAPPPSRVTANIVHFVPCARTHRHRHPLSQTVFVTEAIGLCQRRGGPVEVIRPGDRFWVGRLPAFASRRLPGAIPRCLSMRQHEAPSEGASESPDSPGRFNLLV